MKHNNTHIKNMFFYIVICFVFWLPNSLLGQSYAKVGIVGAQFLKIGVGAKQLGMGSSAMAVVNDAQSIFWNPSGLTSISNINLTVSHVDWFAGIKFESAAIAKNFGKYGIIGLSFNYLSSGDMDVTTYDQQEGTGETFGYTDLMIGATWARNLTDRFSFGGTVKFVKEDYGIKDDVEGKQIGAQSIAFDIGTSYKTGIQSLKMGLAIQNFGPELRPTGKYGDILGFDASTQDYIRTDNKKFRSYPMPMIFRVGIAYDLINIPNHKILIATDVIHPSDNVERINLGMQYSVFQTLSIRTGYIINADAEKFSMGVGLTFAGIIVDYAFLDYGILNTLHTISIGFDY